MINLKVDHPDSELIMNWLYENHNVCGDEDYLLNELLFDLLGSSEFIKLNIYLDDHYQDDITLDKNNVKFII